VYTREPIVIDPETGLITNNPTKQVLNIEEITLAASKKGLKKTNQFFNKNHTSSL
jgi:hypothetical protein